MKHFVQRYPLLRSVLAIPRYYRRSWIEYRKIPVNQMLDRMSQMIISDVIVKVFEFDGNFTISPKSDLFKRIIVDGYYEPELAEIFVKFIDPEFDVIDVGANIGFFSVAAAKILKGGRVLAIEPTQGAWARLNLNLEANGVAEKVVAFKGIASDVRETTEIHFIEGMEEYSSIQSGGHPAISGMNFQTSSVAGMSIDDLVDQHGLKPKLMKIDVEGAEEKVLKGAIETLKKFRPVVISELNRPLLKDFGSSPERIVAIFRELGYDVSDPLRPHNSPGIMDFSDLLCVPAKP